MSRFHLEPSWQQEYETNMLIADDPLAVIYNEVQWKISKVSPLYNLQYDTVKLKQYGTKIRQSIVSSVTADSTTKYVVAITAEPYVKYDEDDSPGLVIKVSSIQEKKTKVAYTAILLSWGVYVTLDGAIHLPYMLEKGEQKIGTAVKTTLQNIFDCQIKQCTFTQYQMWNIAFKFLEQDTSPKLKQFVLVYKTPQSDTKDKLTISFDIGDIKIIWNGVQREAAKKSELVNLAYQMIQNQIHYVMSLDVTTFDLCNVILPRAEVKSSGEVKLHTPEIINCLFLTLNEMYNCNDLKDLTDSSIGSSINVS